jgi:hypothetical protein
MDPLDLKVHDIAIADTTVFLPGGAPQVQRRITFFVGTHGPFTLSYDKAQATADAVKRDIQAEVDTIRDINQIAG